MELKLITAFVNGLTSMLFLAYGVYFLRITSSNRLKQIFGYSMLGWGFLLMKDICLMFDTVSQNEILYKTLLMTDNCAVVSCNLYIIELLRPNEQTWKSISLNFIGFLIPLLGYIIFQKDVLYTANLAFTLIYCIITFLFLVQNTIRYNKMIKSSFSDITNLDIKWLWNTVILMVINLTFWIYMYSSLNYTLDIYYYITLCILWSIIAYKTERQLVFNREETIAPEEITKADLIIPDNSFPFVNRLFSMKAEGYFCQTPHLTLNELAKLLGTNRTTLSVYLNRELGTSFYDFINNSRLDYAEKLLSDSSIKLNLEEIAEKSGFNSLSTFRRSFYKKYSMTPAEFQQKQQNTLQ